VQKKIEGLKEKEKEEENQGLKQKKEKSEKRKNKEEKKTRKDGDNRGAGRVEGMRGGGDETFCESLRKSHSGVEGGGGGGGWDGEYI